MSRAATPRTPALCAAALLALGSCRRAPPPAPPPPAPTRPALPPPAPEPPCDESLARDGAPQRTFPHAEGQPHPGFLLGVRLAVVTDPRRSMLVQWWTDDRDEESEVRFGDTPERLDRVARGFALRYAGAPGRLYHRVLLCGLRGGRTVHYDAGGPSRRSPVYAFATAPEGAEPVRVLVAGDARTHPEVWGSLARRAAEQQAELLLFTGDVAADGYSPPLWERFLQEGAPLLARVPMVLANGNHDGQTQIDRVLMPLPVERPGARSPGWFRLTWGPLAVVVLDDSTPPPEVLVGAERAWLEGALAAVDRARTPWLLAMHHQPLYSTSVGHHPNAVTREAWEPLFDRYRVDLDLAGHMHNYESLLPLRAGLVVPEGEGTVRLTFGGAGAPLYSFRETQPYVRRRERTHGYALLEADAHSLRWTAYREDGGTIETLRWTR